MKEREKNVTEGQTKRVKDRDLQGERERRRKGRETGSSMFF